MTWLDWLHVAALFIAGYALCVVAIVGFVWFLSEPVQRGPERIVDVKNRGHTRIRMPDGSIR